MCAPKLMSLKHSSNTAGWHVGPYSRWWDHKGSAIMNCHGVGQLSQWGYDTMSFSPSYCPALVFSCPSAFSHEMTGTKSLIRCCCSGLLFSKDCDPHKPPFFLSCIVWAILLDGQRWNKMRSNILRVCFRGTELYPVTLYRAYGARLSYHIPYLQPEE